MRKIFVFIVLASGIAASAVPAQAVTGKRGNFAVDCKFSHRLMDDPIVYPGKPGASHLHNFYGNTTTDAFSTLDSMHAGTTTCRLLQDTAGYWNPAGYLDGVRLRPMKVAVYYSGLPNQDVETIPAGLQIIGGDHHAMSAAENPHARWFCGRARTPVSTHPYNCSWYGENRGVTGLVTFPSCWNGTGLTRYSVVYPNKDGACPAKFPHPIPRLSYRVHYGIQDPCLGKGPCGPHSTDAHVKLSLSSGPYYTAHADFWNTWDQEKLDQLVADCINAHIACKKQFSYLLTVSATGTGTGTVSTVPSGITCRSTCKAIYDKGAAVSLEAQPDAGSLFIGWTGDCTGPGPCALVMDANKTVTADFEAAT